MNFTFVSIAKIITSRPIYDLQAQIQRRVLGVSPKTTPPPKKKQTKQTSKRTKNKTTKNGKCMISYI